MKAIPHRVYRECRLYLFMRNGGDDNLDHGGQMSQPLRIRSRDDERVVRQIQETQLD